MTDEQRVRDTTVNRGNAEAELYERGMVVRRAVLGDEYVNRATGSINDFNRDFQRLVTEFCWGSVWTRPGLPLRTRSLLNLAMLTALGKGAELEVHVGGALRNGCSEEEISEALIQAAVYCGIPAAVEAFRIARTVVDAHRASAAIDEPGGH